MTLRPSRQVRFLRAQVESVAPDRCLVGGDDGLRAAALAVLNATNRFLEIG